MAIRPVKVLALVVAGLCLLTAFIYPYLSANSYLNGLLGKPELKGIQTSFELSNAPLSDQYGHQVHLTNLAKKPLFLTFGFTSCSYTCPITMAFFKQIKLNVGPEAQFALITIDPQQDTAERLGQFLANFDAAFIGLRTEGHGLKEIASLLKVNYFQGKEEIIHTDYIYFIHPKLDGILVYTKPDLKMILEDFHMLEQGD
ncbi:SCO family protein [Neptuniibacter sp. 2_MG-2023]|uniref:SCO family protein n=1 Tax=Neptuniibacter sp. 2_MG-2023 TaxID=3062671 RepID=UPI0026E410D4|nr:SCO family protein [Neptuniibacter sp. 2_MG-2023]MDO6515430.1 SCO family protein [Neptuniibacter sp. 2_MG-2023]